MNGLELLGAGVIYLIYMGVVSMFAAIAADEADGLALIGWLFFVAMGFLWLGGTLEWWVA